MFGCISDAIKQQRSAILNNATAFSHFEKHNGDQPF
jgi:hypothetical protein